MTHGKYISCFFLVFFLFFSWLFGVESLNFGESPKVLGKSTWNQLKKKPPKKQRTHMESLRSSPRKIMESKSLGVPSGGLLKTSEASGVTPIGPFKWLCLRLFDPFWAHLAFLCEFHFLEHQYYGSVSNLKNFRDCVLFLRKNYYKQSSGKKS